MLPTLFVVGFYHFMCALSFFIVCFLSSSWPTVSTALWKQTIFYHLSNWRKKRREKKKTLKITKDSKPFRNTSLLICCLENKLAAAKGLKIIARGWKNSWDLPYDVESPTSLTLNNLYFLVRHLHTIIGSQKHTHTHLIIQRPHVIISDIVKPVIMQFPQLHQYI